MVLVIRDSYASSGGRVVRSTAIDRPGKVYGC
jgi:hypothetical protein